MSLYVPWLGKDHQGTCCDERRERSVCIVRNEDSTQIVLDAAQTDKLLDTLSDSALRFRSNYEVIGPYDNYLFHLFFYSSTSLNSSFMIDDKGYVYADGTKYALNRSQEIISYLLSIE